MQIINDIVFGEMCYDYGWRKNIIIELWGKSRNVEIVAMAYSEQGIQDSQRTAYKCFNNNLKSISENSLSKLIEYINKNYSYIKDNLSSNIQKDNLVVEDLVNMVDPKKIIFTKDVENQVIGILCECAWDVENGLAIKITNGVAEEVGPQDIVL